MKNIKEIMKMLPHRYPFLLIDKIEKIESKSIIGIKNVSANEEYFQGHFPENPIMPGVLIVEGMAQCAGVYVASKLENINSKIPLLAGLENVRFLKPVLPGDVVKYHMQVIYSKLNIYKFKGEAYVENKLVCKAEIKSSIIEKSKME